MFKIMVVEDEPEIRSALCDYLTAAGYHATPVENGIVALSIFDTLNPHLIVLDVMMPGIDGFEVLKQLRQYSEVPVIMLTARHAEVDRLKGFDFGVDDYVVKPFSPREVVKRVQAIIKRCYSQLLERERLTTGPFVLEMASQKFYKNGREILLTSLEFSIMQVFMKHPMQWLTRDQLIELALGYDYEGSERNMDAYIKNIRQKIEADSRHPIYLKTKYGAGYQFGGENNDD